MVSVGFRVLGLHVVGLEFQGFRVCFVFFFWPYTGILAYGNGSRAHLGFATNMSGWWLTYPSEKYESVGMMKFPNEWKITFMFQTINQMNITNIRIEHVIRVEHIDMLKNT